MANDSIHIGPDGERHSLAGRSKSVESFGELLTTYTELAPVRSPDVVKCVQLAFLCFSLGSSYDSS